MNPKGALASVEKAVALCTTEHSSSEQEEEDNDPAPPPQVPPSFLAEIAELEVLCKSHGAARGDDGNAANAMEHVGNATRPVPVSAVAQSQPTQPTQQGSTDSPNPTSANTRN